MSRNDAVKTILFNIFIAVLLIVFYHPSLVGLSLTDSNTFRLTCAVTFLPLLLILCIMINRKLIKNGSAKPENDRKNVLLNELNKQRTNELFSKQIMVAMQQIETFEERKKVFQDVLTNNFINDDNYSSFSELIDNAEASISSNCRILLNSVRSFNYTEYKTLRNYDNTYSTDILNKKKQQYNEYFSEISDRVNQNANLLLELDNLIIETNRINDSDSNNELNGLIDMVTAMKQLHFGTNTELTDLVDKYNK